MKEINVKRIPNYRNIIIPKRMKQLPFNEQIYTIWQSITSIGERNIYLFLATYPEDNVKIGFDNTINEKMNMSNHARQEGFRKLVEKGFLQKINEFDYCFIENPTFKTISFINYNSKNPKESNPIQKIKSLLDNHNIPFEDESVFSDCVFSDSGYVAFFDLYINNKYIIEYDGEHHFKSISFWGGEEGYEKRRKHDLEKNKYCFDNNIPIIRIPYDAEYTIDDLKLETTRYLLTPENVQEYYNRS